MSKHITEWMVKPLVGLANGKQCGVDVYRIHNPYTANARIEFLSPVSRFKTEAHALAAIRAAKAAGEQA